MDKPLNRAGLYGVAEKDEQYYRLWVGEDIQEIAQRCLGARRWFQFRNAIIVLSRFGYFAINTLLDTQTPGEEFCEAKSSGCNTLQRLLMVLLNNDLRFPSDIPRPFIGMIKDVHLITYYLFGDFYEFSKRATGVSYIDCSQLDTGDRTTWRQILLDKFVGIITILKLMLNFQEDIKQQTAISDSSAGQAVANEQSLEQFSDIICQLCSGPRKDATSTLCGHVFCWSCIHSWVKDRNECPSCRMPTEPSRLIHLVNFR